MKTEILNLFAENLDKATFTTKGDITNINFEVEDYLFDVNIEVSTNLMLDFEAYNELNEEKGILLRCGEDNSFENEFFEIIDNYYSMVVDKNNTGMQM